MSCRFLPVAACMTSVAVLALSGAALASPQGREPLFVEVRLRDGGMLIGRIAAHDAATMRVVVADGTEVVIPADRIGEVVPIRGRPVGDEFWRDDPLSSKLFLSPTGRSLYRGEAYVAIYQLLVPVVHIGLTDRLSVGIGKPFYVFSPDVWVTAKLQLHRGQTSSGAVGLLHFQIPRGGRVQVVFGAATIGSADRAVTIGAGWLRARIDDDRGDVPVLILSAERRTGRRVKLITENYIFSSGAAFSFGVRFIGGRTFHVETGAALAAAAGAAPLPGPFVNFVWASR